MPIKTELINLDKLENNGGQISGVNANPRDLDEAGFDYCLKSIKHFPEMIEVRTLVVVPYNDKFIVIGGNQRLRALRGLGYVEAPCAIVKDWSADKINQFIVKDNLAYGAWNWDMLANEWDAELLADWGLPIPLKLETIEPIIEDEIPDIPEEPKTKRGDIWLLGEHRLMCGDTTLIDDVEKLICDKKIDLVFTDPPYGIDINYDGNYAKSSGNGVAKRQNYGKIQNDTTIQCAHDCYNLIISLMPEIKIILWGANYYDFLPPSKCWISWYKKDDLPSDTFCDTELAYTNMNKHCKTISVQWKGMIKEGEHDKRVHPTQKPILLAERCFEYFDIKNKTIILDLFGGSGSTLMACENTDRISYNMELDPKYCDVIIKRWQNFTKKSAVLESTKQIFNDL